ncbi:tlde1 domain-containing protein [Pseudescherichia sp.]|uniref:tlde1 domain-containing protein n=1 Tax=Pseudescherichia sp. TaxID=2055881 RepID=UPI002898FC55|nr:tlde1 domain-containing protein [Pseudescherichia sp.]
MAWTYEVRTRNFYLNGIYQFTALYSGAPGYKNDSSQECVADRGPLPRGTYTISEPFYHPHAKAWTLRLTSSVSNHMCGRGGFLIHGDSVKRPGTASNGCIIASFSDRKKISSSHDHTLIVE